MENFTTDKHISYPSYETSVIMDKFEKYRISANANDKSTYEEFKNRIKDFATSFNFELYLDDKTISVNIVAQTFIKDFSIFIEDYETKQQAVYLNEKQSVFKWLVWEKENYVRWIQQTCDNEVVTVDFDILINKDWFEQFIYRLIPLAESYIENDMNNYEYYLNK